jgi:hypothetical protein
MTRKRHGAIILASILRLSVLQITAVVYGPIADVSVGVRDVPISKLGSQMIDGVLLWATNVGSFRIDRSGRAERDLIVSDDFHGELQV